MRLSFGDQIRNNAIALLSLVVALTALGYNTWRNERTEDNRTIRGAGFETILTLGELQQIVFFSHYDKDTERGNPRAGWTRIILLRDLAELIPGGVADSVSRLDVAWADDWDALGEEDAAEARITAAIDETRAATLDALRQLD